MDVGLFILICFALLAILGANSNDDNGTIQLCIKHITALKHSIAHNENLLKMLSNLPTNSSIIYEVKGKNDGIKLAVLDVLQIAKEHKIKTKYDEQFKD